MLQLPLIAALLFVLRTSPGAEPPGKSAGGCPPGMAWLPGGSFTMGERGDRVTVGGLCMDVTEVTVAAYATYAVAPTKAFYPGQSEAEVEVWHKDCNGNRADRQDHPVNCVDWKQATAYCAAQGKRLPTDEEWEWAARGGARGTQYPWGNEPPSRQPCWNGRGNDVSEGQRKSTCPVGSHPEGDSPQGIHDLAGNVWEWTSTSIAAQFPASVTRGGGWRSGSPWQVRATLRLRDFRESRSNAIGFRCVKAR